MHEMGIPGVCLRVGTRLNVTADGGAGDAADDDEIGLEALHWRVFEFMMQKLANILDIQYHYLLHLDIVSRRF